MILQVYGSLDPGWVTRPSGLLARRWIGRFHPRNFGSSTRTSTPTRGGGGGRLSMAFPYNPCDWYIYIIYLPTWMVDFYGKLVGKYTIRGFYDFCIRFKQKTCCTNKIPRLYHMDPWYCYRNSSRYIITHLNIWLHLIPLKKSATMSTKKGWRIWYGFFYRFDWCPREFW